jgi:hypothetical protein
VIDFIRADLVFSGGPIGAFGVTALGSRDWFFWFVLAHTNLLPGVLCSHYPAGGLRG